MGRQSDEQLVQASVELAALTDIPVVATNAVQFIHPDDANIHEIRVCIQEGRLIDDKRRKAAIYSAAIPEESNTNDGIIQRLSASN